MAGTGFLPNHRSKPDYKCSLHQRALMWFHLLCMGGNWISFDFGSYMAEIEEGSCDDDGINHG